MGFSPAQLERPAFERKRGILFMVQITVLTGMLFWPMRMTMAATSDSRPQGATVEQGGGSDYLGVRKCRMCHDRSPEASQADPTVQEFGLTDFVSLTEFHTWYDKDKHARAYKALDEERGKQIGRSLGIEPTKSERCLSCHSTGHRVRRPYDPEVKYGVTCEACHGPGRRWLVSHLDPPWRAIASQEKERLGMVDVRNAVKRAQRCFSCHMGNAAEDKVVTHDIYVAGHPPLPGIEIETFRHQMPSHWISLDKKSDAIKKLLNYNPNEATRTKSVILGSVLALRESVNFFAANATMGVKQNSWPDFADYNCGACHHSLKRPSWRQMRGYRYAAGQPPMREWPETLVKIGIFNAARDNVSYQKKKREFREKLNRLHETVNTRAFGDPLRVGNAKDRSTVSGDLVAWLDQLIAELEMRRYDQPASLRTLQKLCTLADPDDPQYEAYPDFDDARQISWAMMSIYGDLEPKPAKNQEISQIFKRLSKTLNLELEAERDNGTSRSVAAPDPATNYDPMWFKEQLQALSRLLSG